MKRRLPLGSGDVNSTYSSLFPKGSSKKIGDDPGTGGDPLVFDGNV